MLVPVPVDPATATAALVVVVAALGRPRVRRALLAALRVLLGEEPRGDRHRRRAGDSPRRAR